MQVQGCLREHKGTTVNKLQPCEFIEPAAPPVDIGENAIVIFGPLEDDFFYALLRYWTAKNIFSLSSVSAKSLFFTLLHIIFLPDVILPSIYWSPFNSAFILLLFPLFHFPFPVSSSTFIVLFIPLLFYLFIVNLEFST